MTHFDFDSLTVRGVSWVILVQGNRNLLDQLDIELLQGGAGRAFMSSGKHFIITTISSFLNITLHCKLNTNLQVYLDGVVTVVDSKHALHQMR